MTTKQVNDGGPAFPQKEPLTDDWQGMTLRDWFAGQALTSVADDFTNMLEAARDELGCYDKGYQATYRIISRRAYAIADAMLAAREGGAA